MIVDLDAHQGNGHERDHMGDPDTHILDAYNHFIYPHDEEAKKGIATDVEVYSHTDDDDYVENLDHKLDRAIRRF